MAWLLWNPSCPSLGTGNPLCMRWPDSQSIKAHSKPCDSLLPRCPTALYSHRLGHNVYHRDAYHMMTSPNGSIFRVTGPLSGESTGPRWIPRTKASDRALMFSLICTWINGWINNREAGDLRCLRAHYDVFRSAMANDYWVTSMWIKTCMISPQASIRRLPIRSKFATKNWNGPRSSISQPGRRLCLAPISARRRPIGPKHAS